MITPEKAREAIDKQIAQSPAPARPAGRKPPTGRLSRWFNSTKSKLVKFIEKSRNYFNDAAVMSAEKGGWSPEEVRLAGLSGKILDRAEALLAEQADEQARQQQEAQAAEADKVAEQAELLKKMVEARQKPPENPQEPPDIRFFDDEDDEPGGPSLG